MTIGDINDPDTLDGGDKSDVRLGGAEDRAVDERAEGFRKQGIMPDVASIRDDAPESGASAADDQKDVDLGDPTDQ